MDGSGTEWRLDSGTALKIESTGVAGGSDMRCEENKRG